MIVQEDIRAEGLSQVNRSSRESGGLQRAKFSLGIIIRISLVFLVLCGILLPLVSTGLAQVLMPGHANGSLIENSKGEVVGSELIGQSFTDPRYFQGRVSSIDYKDGSVRLQQLRAFEPRIVGENRGVDRSVEGSQPGCSGERDPD